MKFSGLFRKQNTEKVGMIQVKSFLGCFSLETFALVIGCVNLIPMILLALLSTSALVKEIINQSEKKYSKHSIKLIRFINRWICCSCTFRIIAGFFAASIY